MFSVQGLPAGRQAGFRVQEGEDDWRNSASNRETGVEKTYMDVEDLEKSLEKHLPESERRWKVKE